MHRNQHIVTSRNQRAVVTDYGRWKQMPENRNGMPRPGELPAHGNSHGSSQHQVDDR